MVVVFCAGLLLVPVANIYFERLKSELFISQRLLVYFSVICFGYEVYSSDFEQIFVLLFFLKNYPNIVRSL